tara:strand:- start:1031 stop:1246 length:216 start_codon:yes stop_codon:yes gene_type:complete
MSKLRKFFKLDLIGWMWIVLALFELPSIGIKFGALLILLSHIKSALNIECIFCPKTGTFFRKNDCGESCKK